MERNKRTWQTCVYVVLLFAMFLFLFVFSCTAKDLHMGGGQEGGIICEEGSWRECSEGPWLGACRPARQYCFGTFWGHCVDEVLPVPEVCDNTDNDCDGVVDNGVRNPCNECGETPVEECDGEDNDCDGTVDESFAGIAELCNAIDDDCDGTVDEGWSKRMECDIGEINPWLVFNNEDPYSTCDSGWRECRDGEMTECFDFVGPAPEICDSLDNDCNGIIDDMSGLGEECGVSSYGECELGQILCIQEELACYGATLPENETCDGLDNDCDGATDEGLIRECQTQCDRGVEECIAGVWKNCTARSPILEICDGLDNDCDGSIDEDLTCPCFEGQRQVCRPSSLPACGYGIQICEADGTWGECEGEIPTDELCNDYDDDCDQAIDEALFVDCYDGDPGTEGVAACTHGQMECLFGMWGIFGCEGQVVPEEEICDGIDNDCDGQVDNLERIFEKVDMIFAIDVSGSMSGIIEDLLLGISNYVNGLNVGEHRFGIVLFGSHDTWNGESGSGHLFAPLQNMNDFLLQLAAIETDGSVEPSLDVAHDIADPSNPLGIGWRSDATPMAILLTDEMAQSNRNHSEIMIALAALLDDCQLSGCDSATNPNWTNGDSFELFVFTVPALYSPWNILITAPGQRLFNIGRVAHQASLEADLNLVFAEICLEQ